jgi:hypothetical protein
MSREMKRSGVKWRFSLFSSDNKHTKDEAGRRKKRFSPPVRTKYKSFTYLTRPLRYV